MILVQSMSTKLIYSMLNNTLSLRSLFFKCTTEIISLHMRSLFQYAYNKSNAEKNKKANRNDLQIQQ